MILFICIILLGVCVHIIASTIHEHRIMDKYETEGYNYVVNYFKAKHQIPTLPMHYLHWDSPHKIGFKRGYNKAYEQIHHHGILE